MSERRITVGLKDDNLVCPNCKVYIGEGTYKFSDPVVKAGKLISELELLGVKVDHDCSPGVTR